MIEFRKSTFYLLDFGNKAELTLYPWIARSMNPHSTTAPD